jgi:hypothetical protein
MRLLSFLSDIERALVAESPVVEGGAWASQRMVNFKQQLGRLSLTARPGADLPVTGGTVFLQSFALADGSLCLKANLSWNGSETSTSVAVYDVPGVNWKLEASKIASAWLNGPVETATVTTTQMSEASLTPLIAVAS